MSTDNEISMEELVRKKLEGKSYSSIREDLAEYGLNDEEIGKLIRQVDERVLSALARRGDRDRTQQWYRLGLILAVIGLILSIAYNAGIILEKLPALLIYSPFFAGILLMFYGRFLQKKQSKTSDSGTGAIRRKRPYK